MAAQKERDAAAVQKALDKEQKAELRRKKKEEEAAKPKKSGKRAVIQYSDDGTIIREFESVASAAKEVGIASKGIRDAANGVQKHAGGFCWRYADAVEDNRFSGMCFAFTGKLETLTYSEAQNLVERYGGRVSESVTKRTIYLVAGADADAKLDNAKDFGIPVLTESEFLNMVDL